MRLTNFTTYLLIAVYAVVGVTGDSLHYLLPDAGMVFVGTDESEEQHGEPAQTSFAHYHAPDFHWHAHSHGHSHSRAKHDAAARPSTETTAELAQAKSPSRKSKDTQQDSIQAIDLIHQDHACPWLSLVAEIELGLERAAACFQLSEPQTDLSVVASARDEFAYFSRALPRGPPA